MTSWRPTRCGFLLLILAYDLGNVLRRSAEPAVVKDSPMRTLQVKLTKIEGRPMRHARRLVLQLAEVVALEMFQKVLGRIGRLCPVPG